MADGTKRAALSKKDVVTLALHELGGATDVVDTEDIAIAAHTHAPDAFGWRKHSEQIDLELVRTALRHEAEGSNPRVAGSIRTGWHLTPTGLAWATRFADRARDVAPPGSAPAKVAARRSETRHLGAEADRLRTSDAYRIWTSGGTVPEREAAAVFRIDHYTSERDRHLKIGRLRELIASDAELVAFVDAVSETAVNIRPPVGRVAERNKEPG